MKHFDQGALELAAMPLKGNDRAILTALTARMTYEGPFMYSTSEIAEQTGMVPQNVSRAVRNLKDAGVLVELPHRKVIIHPRFFWKGGPASRQDWIKRIENGDLTDE